MSQRNNRDDRADAPAPKAEDDKGLKETWYDKVPLTKGQLDVVIVLLVLAFVVVVILGVRQGNGAF